MCPIFFQNWYNNQLTQLDTNKTTSVKLEIIALSHRGDGIAFNPQQHLKASDKAANSQPESEIHLPGTIPGEIVEAQPIAITGNKDREPGGAKICRYEIVRIIKVSPERVKPACSSFKECGGCQLQHLSEKQYRSYKENRLFEALKNGGFPKQRWEPLILTGKHSRRRARWKLQKMEDGKFHVGTFRFGSHYLLPVKECPILEPSLLKFFNTLEEAIQQWDSEEKRCGIQVSLTHTGLDIFITLSGTVLFTTKEIETFCTVAQKTDVTRMTLMAKKKVTTLYQARKPQMRFGDYLLTLPTESFVQPTYEGERLIQELILNWIPPESRVCDLFSGCGTYTFPLLTKGHHVTSYESDSRMIACQRGATHSKNTKRHEVIDKINSLSIIQRDLYYHPLEAEEFHIFDFAVINPPRCGAPTQIPHLAMSNLKGFILISCNPASLEMDLAHLKSSKFRLKRIVAIDQFHWSCYLETILFFENKDEEPE